MTTKSAKFKEIERSWHLVDLKDQILGRGASQIAQLLIGKTKTNYSPQLDMGDWVVVINADKVKTTGKKIEQKVYRRHSGYPGGYQETTLSEQMAKDSTKVIISAVKGMLPKNKLQARYLARLKVFPTSEHPYQAELTK